MFQRLPVRFGLPDSRAGRDAGRGVTMPTTQVYLSPATDALLKAIRKRNKHFNLSRVVAAAIELNSMQGGSE
jgi:hypothetical protein